MKTAESINFAYDPKSDRIALYACYPGSTMLTRVEITRRFLSLFLPSISARISEQGLTPLRAGKIAPDVQHNRATAAREHNIARQIPVTKKQVKRSQVDDKGFLAHVIAMKTNARGLVLTVMNESKDREIRLQMTELEFHRFIDRLTAVAARADWGLADPWAAVKSASYQPSMAH